MSEANIVVIYDELGDFLPEHARGRPLKIGFSEVRSVKDLLESVGVPHTEIDVIYVNESAVRFDYQVQPGDRIAAFPRLARLPKQTAIHCLPPWPENPRFILDVHLGKLAAYMRMSGFDCLYRNDFDDSSIALCSSEENRIVLTCDRRLLMRKSVILGYYVRSRQPKQQLNEVYQRLKLANKQQPFTRCMSCNGLIDRVNKESVAENLQPLTRKYYQVFKQCQQCRKVYWQGSHVTQMQQLLKELNIVSEAL